MPSGSLHIPRRQTPEQVDALFAGQRSGDPVGVRIHLLLALGACFMAGWSTTFVAWAALPVLICFLVRLTGWHRMIEPLAFDWVVRLLLVWGAWVALSVLWSEGRGARAGGFAAWTVDVRTLEFLAFPILLWPVMDRRSWLAAAMIAGIACGQLSQLVHLAGVATGASWMPYHRMSGRISGWWDPVSGGTVLCAGLGLWLAPAMWGAAARVRWIGTLGALGTLGCIALTGTRGAWIGAVLLVLIAMCVCVVRRRSVREVAIPFGAVLAGACVVVGCAAFFVVQHKHDGGGIGIEQRVRAGIDEVRSGFGPDGWQTDTGLRIAMWRWAGAEWRTHPIAGVGAGGYQPWVLARTVAEADRLGAPSGAIHGVHPQAHSMYFHTLATLGTVGFVLLIALVIVAIVSGLRDRGDGSNGRLLIEGSLAAAPGLGLIGLACAGLFDTITVNQQPSYVLYLLIAMCLPTRPRESVALFNVCPKCGYSLQRLRVAGGGEVVCPECGAAVNLETTSRASGGAGAMNILVIGGRTARQPWTAGDVTARVCTALAARGHRVVFACQSLDDPAMFAACAERHAFDSFDQTATDWPLGFAGWARGKRREVSHDVCLSLSRVVGGDVWMPLEPSGRSWVERARRTLSAKSLGIAIARHSGAMRAWVMDAMLAAPLMRAGQPLRRVIAVGATSAGEASRALHRVRGLGERVVKVDPFGILDPPASDRIDSLRDATRSALDIGADRRVILVSAPLPVGKTLDGLLAAIADIAARDPGRGPMLLALARDCFALHSRAIRLGAGAHVRIIGLTERMDAALAAADVVALPHKAQRGLFASGAVGRLGVDALRFGRPLLALSGAGGYGLARLRAPSQEFPGLVIDYPTADAWNRALRQVGDDRWLERASAAAAEIGAPMRLDRFVDRLETVLNEAATERAADLGRR